MDLKDLKIGCWNIRGLSTSDKQKEVKNFIDEEGLNVCAVLETHSKTKKLNKIADRIFGQWEWVSNMQHCDKGCRIVLGWNSLEIRMSMVHCSKQSMLCCVETVDDKVKLFCTFVYAANSGNERKELWKDFVGF